MPEELTRANCGGQWHQIVVRNPDSVCCEESLLVIALRTIGVRLHPAPGFAFRKLVDGQDVYWRWVLAEKSSDGAYLTADLVKWWKDPAWRQANRMHEWAIVITSLVNMGLQAREIRDSPSYIVVRKGKSEAHIPSTATDEYRVHILAQLEGRIPVEQEFTGPRTVHIAA